METRINGGSSVLCDDVIDSRAYHLFRCILFLVYLKMYAFSIVPTTQNLHVIHGRRHLLNISSSQRDTCPTDFAFSLRNTNQQKQ